MENQTVKFIQEKLNYKIEERDNRCKSLSYGIGENGKELSKKCHCENAVSDLMVILVLNTEIDQLKEQLHIMCIEE